MPRLQLSTFLLLIAPALVACGDTISQIDGLPQTRDVSSAPWPMLVDTPAAPTDTLLPETGARTLVTLENAQVAALSRKAEPGPARVETVALQGKVARIDARTQVSAPAVDSADLSARAARLSQLRQEASNGVAVDDLRARAQRLSMATQRGYGGVDSADLQNRAQQIKARTQTYYGVVDRVDLATRSEQIRVSTSEPAPQPAADIQTPRRAQPAPPAPRPVAKAKRAGRDEPVVSSDFRQQAREALERAKRRASAPPPE
jgi:hypothetical protein